MISVTFTNKSTGVKKAYNLTEGNAFIWTYANNNPIISEFTFIANGLPQFFAQLMPTRKSLPATWVTPAGYEFQCSYRKVSGYSNRYEGTCQVYDPSGNKVSNDWFNPSVSATYAIEFPLIGEDEPTTNGYGKYLAHVTTIVGNSGTELTDVYYWAEQVQQFKVDDGYTHYVRTYGKEWWVSDSKSFVNYFNINGNFNTGLPTALQIATYDMSKVQQYSDMLTKIFWGTTPEPDDPTPGGSSTSGGGGGSFNNTSTTIPSYTFSPNESSSNFVGGAASSSLVSIYLPTKAQLKEFASQLWDPSLANTLAKMSVDPIDFVVSFHMLPISPPVAGQSEVVYGNVVFKNSLTFNYSATQYTTVDMGTIDVAEYWGNFLDYGPFTKISIYLPYIGFQNLDPDDVMGGKIHLVYNVDLVSGACLASLYVTRSADGTDLSAPLYTFGGNMASKIPLSSISGGNAAIAAASAVLPVATTVAAGTMAGVGGAMASEAVQAGSTAGLAGAQAMKGAATALQGATAGAVLSGKMQVGRSGGFEQSSGFLGPQTPYLVISRPIQSIPNGYNTYEGYPSNITAKLSDLSGFTQIESIHLNGIICTETERDELETLLKTGVII